MADSDKRDKLAAAKKKLKKFQTQRTPSSSLAPTNRKKMPVMDNPGVQNALKNQSSTPKRPQANGPQFNSIPHSPVTPGGDQSAMMSTYSTPVGNHGNSSPAPGERITESTERLQHLSRQINGLISESSAYINNIEQVNNVGATANSDLESRNQQLASFLEQHAQANEQLTKQLDELRLQNSKLHQNLDAERKGFEDKLRRELGALKEQLQVHIQTIGILVAEKTELQSSLNQTQKIGEQRNEELEELQGRLKASRQRVNDLERSFTNASSSNQKHEQLNKDYSKDVDRLKLELYKLNKSNEEFQQQNSEIQGKLQKKNSECSKLEDGVIELKGRLEMTQLHLQQLQNGSAQTVENTQQVDQLVTEKGELEAKLGQHEKSLQKVTLERDQYQAYIDQLNQQTHHLQQQISSLSEDKDQGVRKHRELENIIDDLKSRQDTVAMGTMNVEKENSLLEQSLRETGSELEQYRVQYQAQVSDNNQLSRLVSEKEERIMDLELTVQRLADNQVDSEQLLTNMQSDKTALSRAIAQNKELKNQLAELQNGFVKMSNDNMDLMTTVQTEQHTAKELAVRLGHQEEELKDMREELGEKERLLTQQKVERSRLDSETQGQTTEEIENRLKEFQGHTPLLESMQRELASAQDTINALTNQNSELRAQMLRDTSQTGYESDSNNSQGGSHQSPDKTQIQVESLSASVRQLEAERDQVLQQLSSEQEEREAVISKLQHLQQELATQAPATLNGDVISKAQFEALQHAMKQLEGKFSKAMRDKADLLDKSEQLEHIIMQLQGETDTIGEYIALYQTQRSILKERTMEKDHYISHMARERQEMQDKLGQLQALVMQLLGERQTLHSYHDNNNTNDISMVTTKQTPQTHHEPAAKKSDKPFGSNLDSSHLEDWPDYSTDSDSDDSQVERIVGGDQAVPANSHVHSTPSPSPQPPPEQSPHAQTIPAAAPEDQTAQRIMHLLTEIGHSNLVDRSLIEDRDFLHCGQCTGQLLNV